MISKFWPACCALFAPMRRLSLKLRLLVLTVGIFVPVIWALALVSTDIVESRLQDLLAKQQFAATSQLAFQLEEKLQETITGLVDTATRLPAELSHESIEKWLADRTMTHGVFADRLMVIGLDGKAIADYPVLGGYQTYYGDRDWFREVLTSGKPYIDKPVIGRVLLKPVLTIAVPVLDTDGRVRAVLITGIDPASPRFLGLVSNSSMLGDGELFVFDLRHQLIIAATDRQRVMTPAPARGRNTLYDRMVDGFEGSGIAVSSQGIPKLYSGKRVPTAGWLILAALPTEIAFGPLHTIRNYLYGFALFLTLLAVLALVLIVRRVLAPLDETTHAIGQMTDRQRELAPLPVPQCDEIAGLVHNFNRLLLDRLEYETALGNSERHFRQLIEGAPDAVFVQTQGCFCYLNSAALKLFGATTDSQLLGQPVLDRVHPDCRSAVDQRIKQMNEEKRPAPPQEQKYLRLDGNAVNVEVSGVPLRYGESDGGLIFARDISDKKNVELELTLYRNHLEELVADRTAELAIAKQMAEQSSRAKSDFLATMSHEIRNPLTAVVGLTDLLVDSPLDRQQRDCAEQIKYSAQALRALIDDILDFSKIEAGALQLELLPFSLKSVLRSTAAVLSVGVRGKAVEPLLEFPLDIPDTVVGDALRLQQILLNLTSNAVKFTEAGSILVSIRLLSQQPDKVSLRFAVSDTGIGIATEQLGPIFEVFTQADSSICRNYGGSGLGLAISNRLLGLMDSQMHVDSTPGQGSEFSFELTLPLGKVEPVPVQPQPAYLNDLHILIIDDHPLARDILVRTCAAFGWRATACASGAEGLAELQQSAAAGRDYDLLLLDWRMPEMDGLEMLRRAQSTPGIGLPLVLPMASAFELEQLVAASDDLYLDGIVAKPVIPEVLLEAVQRAYTGQEIELEPTVAKPDRRLLGMRLLVVEDNEINRGLIEKMLCRSGAEVELAVNGQAAVAAIEVPGNHFDAVLMDLQMPIMDGYSATKVIRHDLGLLELPIIAVTAHALPEDYHKARQVGMDGLITKPINLEELLDILGNLRQSVPCGPVTPAVKPPTESGTGDWDEATYQALLTQFLTQHGADTEHARALFAQGDLPAAARLVHEVGGVTSFLGVRELARLAAQTEKALLKGELAPLPGLFDELAVAMAQLRASCPGFTDVAEDLPG